MRVYLGGPINGCGDEEATAWREAAKPLLEAAGHGWIDPMDRDYRGREMEPGIAAEIVELDKSDVVASDAQIMNCPKPSVGTSMEVLYAWQLKRDPQLLGRRGPIICVVPQDREPSPWLLYHADHLCASVEEAVTFLEAFV